jgi:uncharacterized damage-inducible protein DinB
VRMKMDEILHLFGYNRWATGMMMDAADRLTAEEFVEPDDTPFGSIRNELVHILDAQVGWIDICSSYLKGVDREVGDLVPEDYPDVESVHAAWDQVESTTDSFLSTIDESDLARVIRAEFDWGVTEAPLWVILLHVVNHGTQHRSELAMKLTNFGYSPGMVDLLFYWMAQQDAG